MEWPQALISTVFALILFGMGLFMMFKIAEPVITNTEFLTYELEAGILAARIYNSPDCLAWEENIGGKIAVHSGVIDLSKHNPSETLDDGLRIKVKSCLQSNSVPVNIGLTDSNGNEIVTAQKIIYKNKYVARDYYLVKIKQLDGTFTDGRLFVEVAF
ncbi:MAG: hypothetical protein J4451_02505 [DPANN group archaeon]|nr:hypothetical protein [DPANN group archaeon]